MARPGYPSMGAWVTYGLGSMNDNLPAFVVMHDAKPRGDDGIWSPGLPAQDATSRCCSTPADARRSPTCRGPPGMTDAQQQAQLDLLRETEPRAPEAARADQPDLSARIHSFELAYRMQTAAPEALDISQETAGDAEALRHGQPGLRHASAGSA